MTILGVPGVMKRNKTIWRKRK